MSAKFFNLICSIVVGLIGAVVFFLIHQSGQQSFGEQALFYGLVSGICCYIVLIPNVFKKIQHICSDYDWADECARIYHEIPKKYRQSFWSLFGLINLAFLFHTMHFMWGNEDWGAVRYAVDSREALHSGSFSLYWLQELIFDGKILPVINNLWAFAGLSLAGVLLAIYWNLPQRATPIVITGLLFAVTPYTMSIMYHARYTLAFFWLPVIVLTALILSEKFGKDHIHTYCYNLVSVLLFLWALGTYMPVINFVAVAVLGKMLLKVVYADVQLHDSSRRICQGVANFTAALMIYLLIIFILYETNQLEQPNSLTYVLSEPLRRLPLLFKYAFLQFALPFPFMDTAYKIVYLILGVLALYTLIFDAPNAKAAARGLVVLPFLIIFSLVSILFAEDVNFLRMSFFGLPFLYALAFVSIVGLGHKKILKAGYLLAIILIFMNFVRVAYIEKVWKFGWDAETKLAERIITRLEKMPEFDISRQYQLLQIGEKSLRHKYYQKKPDEANSPELLTAAYYKQGNATDAYNFFYQTDFLKGDARADALQNSVIKDYLLNKARAWPAQESLFIFGDYIVIVLDDNALALVQKGLR